MGHHHHDHSGHDHGHHHEVKNLKLVFFINLAFTLIEIGGGLWTGSIAILSDALHDFGDSLSLGLAWYFQGLSQKKRDDAYSYGYRRFSLMGAFINSVVLAVGSGLILREAIPKLWNPGEPMPEGMAILAVLGIVFNGIAFYSLSGGNSMNSRVARLHLLEDVLGWVAVGIGATIMLITPLPIIDPILSIGIALYILWNVWGNLRKAGKIFLQAIPPGVDMEEIAQNVEAVEGVVSIHDLHVWSLDGEFHVLTIHLVLKDELTLSHISQLKQEVRQLIETEHIRHVTIEVEGEDEHCGFEDC